MCPDDLPSASRQAPPRVPPVAIGGTWYAQVAGDVDLDGQVGGLLAAFDASNRELWRIRVYQNVRHPDLEEDAQDVWFRSLQVDNGRLRIENEEGWRFEVDPATRQVVALERAPRPNAGISSITGQPFFPLPTRRPSSE